MSNHPLQSPEWKTFREKTGVKVVRESNFQLTTIHKIPYLPFTIGYLPKGPMPTEEMLAELLKIGKKEKCIFIQLEPNVVLNRHSGERSDSRIDSGQARMTDLKPSFHPLFTKYTFILDLTKSEEELLKDMHPKTRYNIRVAQKHGVEIVEDNSDKAFEDYLKLTRETTSRQGFYAHTEKYHRLMWETLKVPSFRHSGKPKAHPESDSGQARMTNRLSAHLLLAKYKDEVLAAWILFVYDDTLYYPYGASSSKHRETMASNLMMWEAIRFGKKLGLKKFDIWGALGNDPDPKDPWYGFHRFKQGYGPKHIEFIGSFDLVINPILYQIYKLADHLRWVYLRFKK